MFKCIYLIVLLFAATQLTAAQTQAADPCADLTQRLTSMDKRLKDFAQQSIYRDANLAVATPARNEKRVVFFGDSITDSWDDPVYGGFFPGKAYINRGISGQTTPQMLIRFRPDVIDLKPKVVVILAGTNDLAGNTGPTTLEAIQGNLTSMAELARLNGIRVVLASILPISDYEMRERKPIVQSVRRAPERIVRMNEWLKSYAAKNRLVYLDYYSAMRDEKGFLKDDLSDDGLHPNQKGYEVMAPLVEAAIEKAMR